MAEVKAMALFEAYEGYTDEDLLSRVRHGDYKAQDCIITKYKNFVKIKSHAYFIMGADREDIIQEGMIGLYKAIRDYNPDKLVSFSSFAELCVTRQIITAIKAATRQKHIPLNYYVSLNKTVYDEETDKTYMDMLAENKVSNPEELLIGREDKNYIEEHMGAALSTLECRVLSLYIQGKSYYEIAELLSRDEKSIDNALQRVRRKVEQIMLEKNTAPINKKRSRRNAKTL